MVTIKIERTENGKDLPLPTFSHKGDACADLRSAEDLILEPRSFKAVSTGIKAEIPLGYEIQVRPRSGLALNYGVTILNSPGTIDSGYRGEIKVILINHSLQPFSIKKGDRIAQISVKKVERVVFEITEKVSATERGEGGFGSTGIK